MIYEINDRTLISELCGEIRNTVQSKHAELTTKLKNFSHPLDENIIGQEGILKKLLSEQETAISYSKAEELDKLWYSLLNKSIICLRYFDKREPFLHNPDKAIVAYGLDKLEEYHRRYTEFESLMYGSSAYYRDHVFHAIRVWMLGVSAAVVNFLIFENVVPIQTRDRWNLFQF